MGGAQYKSETPQQLIPTYESSAGSSGSGSSPDANASLNSSTTNTASTASISRHLNKRRVSDDEVIFSVKLQGPPYDYDTPVTQSPDNRVPPNAPPSAQAEETEDFLPICDALFNVICLLGYFCDIVFDVLSAYSFYQEGLWEWALVAMGFIVMSMVVCQVVSFGWYRAQDQEAGQETPCSTSVLVLLHVTLCGVLWRYFKLFTPVDIRFVKSEVRDLCLLRLIHAFAESAPMLLLQLYLTFLKPTGSQVTDLTLVSSTLSLFTLCWALASYSKNIRRQNVHKLVLTWLGVIFQFLWRLGTVTARVTALAVYATVYGYWIFLVLILHWFCMVLWVMSPRNIFSGEKLSGPKKTSYSALISVVYLLCFINVQEVPSRQKVTIFYVTMFLENTLLVGVWLIASRQEALWYQDLVLSVVFGAFALGIFFMTLYYSYFHVRKLSYGGGTVEEGKPPRLPCGQVTRPPDCDYYSSVDVKEYNGNYQRSSAADFVHGESGYFAPPEGKDKRNRAFYNKINGHHIHHPNVPGVFNCRFNPAMKRKKKKPSSFVPPPPLADTAHGPQGHEGQGQATSKPSNLDHGDIDKVTEVRHPACDRPGKMANPFWKRPHSVPTVANDPEEGSVSSSRRYRQVDIHQKLQAKREQQIAELKAIEEEIRQGKLRNRPSSAGVLEERIGGGASGCKHLIGPPPEKQPPWFRGGQGSIPLRAPIILPTVGDELMLDPNYLVGHSGGPTGFYERVEWNNFYEPVVQGEEDEDEVGFGGDLMGESVSDMMNEEEGTRRKSRRRRKSPLHYGHDTRSRGDPYFFSRGQGSLPLERNGGSSRVTPKRVPENVISTNSSDADVDSGGEEDHYEEMTSQHPSVRQIRLPQQHKRFPKQKQPETPL